MAPFRKILCPIDFSSGSRQAMRVAIRLANESNAELVLLHVWYVPIVSYSTESLYPTATLDTMSENAMTGVDEAVRDAKSLGATNVSGAFDTGVPWAQIVAVLADPTYDLCVIGTHGRTGLTRVVLGSIAEKVVRHAPCSVMAVRADSRPEPFKHGMCPTDFSASAAFAADLAGELVTADGTITLLHVIEVPVAYSGEVTVDDVAPDLDRRSATALENEGARLRRAVKARVTTRARVGYPGAQTLAALDHEPTIDLVVMGSHGRTGLRRVVLGSVAEKIVRHASCPVLVARKRV